MQIQLLQNPYRALFLDRDGVVNEDRGHVHRVQDFVFIAGVFETCHTFINAGYKILIVTNQAGIGRGLYSEKEFLILTRWMCHKFRENSVLLEGVYYCPHHPTEAVGQYKISCECRKPNPGMLLLAAKEHHINLGESILVGDRVQDLMAAERAGIGTKVLVRSGHPINLPCVNRADLIVDSLGSTRILQKLINQ